MIPLGGFAQPGEKSVANFDEDSLTMAVEAARDCLVGVDSESVDSWYFASVTPPFVEKQSASIAASVLDLGEETYTVDPSGLQLMPLNWLLMLLKQAQQRRL